VCRPIWLENKHQFQGRILKVSIFGMVELLLDASWCGFVVFQIAGSNSLLSLVITTIISALLSHDIDRTARYWSDEWFITISWAILLFVAGCFQAPGISGKYLGALAIGWVIAVTFHHTVSHFSKIQSAHAPRVGWHAPFSVALIKSSQDQSQFSQSLSICLPMGRYITSNPKIIYPIGVEESIDWTEIAATLVSFANKAFIEISYLPNAEGVMQEVLMCMSKKLPTMFTFEVARWEDIKVALEKAIGQDISKERWGKVLDLNDWRVCFFPVRHHDLVDQRTVRAFRRLFLQL
jgi:hypothetical protein